MTTSDTLAIQEFRRFANTHIYPETSFMLTSELSKFGLNEILIDSIPTPTIKCKLESCGSLIPGLVTKEIHDKLKDIFVNFYRNDQIEKLINKKINENTIDDRTATLIRSAYSKIYMNDKQYIYLLFNLTVFPDGQVYVYL